MTRAPGRSARGRAALAGACGLVAALACAGALADTPPSIWDCARDPAERTLWNLHVRVERLLHSPASSDDSALDDPRQDAELRLEAARALLEAAGAGRSPDVRLRFDLGEVYQMLGDAEGRSDLYEKAASLLAPAVEQAPNHPAATDALEHLIYADAHLGRAEDELALWRQYLPRVTDERVRAGDLMNMGEAQMRLGLLDEALATFREGLRLCEELPNTDSSETYVLTLWDQAVARDRSGDPRGAMDDASHALRINLGILNGGDLIEGDPHVFFVPAWERQWYLALKYAAVARSAKDAHDALDAWTHAQEHWDLYIQRSTAGAAHDPFLAIARVRRERVALERDAAEKRASKLAPRRAAPKGPWAGG